MARMIAEPRTVTLARPVTRRTMPVAPQVIAPPTTKPVLGDRVNGARPRTTVARRKNRPISREMAVVLLASCVVSILCLYVTACARVTAEGFELARLTQKIGVAEAREQSLQASISSQMALETIAKKAAEIGMEAGQTSSIRLVTDRPTPPVAEPIIDSAGSETTAEKGTIH